MSKVLRISFALKNTYRVNSILYSLKQVPGLKKILSESLYRVKGLKIAANVLSVIWEILTVFGGKCLYFLFMILGMGLIFDKVSPGAAFLHMLLFLTMVGSYMNTHMFNPTRDKYYALMILRMEARSYTLTNYGMDILKVFVGFLPFSLLGLGKGLSLWQCLLIPLYVTGAKLAVAGYSLCNYQKFGKAANENVLTKGGWILAGALLAAAYVPPAFGAAVPTVISSGIMAAAAVLGVIAVRKILTFDNYYEMYKEILTQAPYKVSKVRTQEVSQKAIAIEEGVGSSRKGFEYLNELFILRHQKILWKSSKRITAVSLGLFIAAAAASVAYPDFAEKINRLLLTYLPYFVFIMYAVNRGTSFTQALFMNCDHSLLTYSFYKQPKHILKLFQIRLKEIIKINLLPAFVIGAGLALLLRISGGTDEIINYWVLFISVICLSIFFSMHYLTIYYLLQPYNAGTEMKSATYRLILIGTYLVCFYMMQIRMSTVVFGVLTIVFCVVYCAAACILIYRLAPRTFRLRM